MSEIQYRTAKNIKEAVTLMAAAKGKGYILAADRSPRPDEVGMREPAPSST